MNFETVTVTVGMNDATAQSGDVAPRKYGPHYIPPSGRSDDGKSETAPEKYTSATSYRSAVTTSRNDLRNLRREGKHRDKNLTDDGSRIASISDTTASNSVDRSSAPRVLRIDRNHPSVTTTSAFAAVTATKIEVSSRAAAKREEFSASRRLRNEAEQGTENPIERQPAESVAQVNPIRVGRRRRGRGGGAANDQSAPLSRNVHARKPRNENIVVGSAAANTEKKFSPYPAYIQLFAEDSSIYRREVNRILSHDTRSNTYSNRNRKISTEMNRYESSSSKSSSSESDDEPAINSPPSSGPVGRLSGIKPQNKAVDTPDTSDCESRFGSKKRTRNRVGGLTIKSKDPEDRVNTRVRNRPRIVGLQPPAWDDKYGSLPDNYKHPEIFPNTKSIRVSGNDAPPLIRARSQDHEQERSPAAIEPATKTNMNRTNDRNNVNRNAASAEGKARSPQGNMNLSPRTLSDRLMIDNSQLTRSSERLNHHYESAERADISASTPDLVRDNRTFPRTNENGIRIVRGDLRVDGKKSKNGDEVQHPLNTGVSELIAPRNLVASENEVIPSQPKIQARKVSEDFWPRDEDTQRLLNQPRTTSSRSTSPEATVIGSSAASCAMQETINQLQSFVNETERHRLRSSSNVQNDRAKVEEPGTPTESPSRLVIRRGSNNFTSNALSNKLQPTKPASDVASAHMSSTETLKEFSTVGEYPDKNSRSPSIESVSSNPEVNNAVYTRRLPNSRTLPSKSKNNRATSADQHQPNTPAVLRAGSAEDIMMRSSKSTLEKINHLTESVRNLQILPNPSAPLQHAVVRTEPVHTVSQGNVQSHQTMLETVNEHPEPTISGSRRIFGPKRDKSLEKKPNIDLKRENSLEIDEGVITDEIHVEDPKSFMKLDQYLEESDKRNGRKLNSPVKTTTVPNENESLRSLSDPSSERKRSQPAKSSVDSNLIESLPLRNKQDMGSIEQSSLSSSSQFSEQPSSLSDTLNIDELIKEEQQDVKKIQSKDRSKKKSKSDPNPEGCTTLDAEPASKDEGYGFSVASASSEPNVLEQGDSLGDLDEFQRYKSTKGLNTINHVSPPMVDDVPDGLKSHISPRSSRKSLKTSKIIENSGNHGSSIVSQLLNENSLRRNDEDTDIRGNSSGRSFSSSFGSEESSPVPNDRDETLFEFEKVLDSMTSKSGGKNSDQQHTIHSRSNSEPVRSDPRGQFSLRLASANSSRTRRDGSTSVLSKPDSQNSGIQDVTTPDDAVFTTPRERYGYTGTTPEKEHSGPDKRLHVFRNLLETEKSYVNSLRILLEDYMKPLKHPDHHSTCEPRLVDEMFYKIPQLLQHHENFYESVKKCYDDWGNKDVRLGELFLNSFKRDALLDTYTAYITNYLNAREAVRTAEAKEAFRRFMEQCRSENKEKQGLADLMIQPVQRIPRYELLIKDMLKHTPEGHPDRNGLVIAQNETHKLAVQMNKSKKDAEAAEEHDRLLNELEQLIEGCMDLCDPKRRFVRQEIVTEIGPTTKKDRCIWLFSDLIVCSTRKGRAGTAIRRGSIISLHIGQERSPNIELGYKYKFLWKFSLEDVENLKGGSAAPGRENVEKQLQTLQSDMNILSNMQKMAVQIDCNHPQLDEALRDIVTHVGRQLQEKKQLSLQSLCPPRVELGISTAEGMKTFLFEFSSDDNKVQFEIQFAKAKRNLTSSKSIWEPTFMTALPISRTRAGMQFSCAAPNVDSSLNAKEVWVCNTDGYVGQVCFLTLDPEPNQTQCVTVCHARICCIAQVPAFEKKLVPTEAWLSSLASSTASQSGNQAVNIMSWDDTEGSDEENTSPHSTSSASSSMHSQSPQNTMNGEYITSPDLVSLPGFVGGHNKDFAAAYRVDAEGSTIHGSLDDLLQDGETVSGDPKATLTGKDSMWLGTEDGKIHIYPSSQSTRGDKHCVRLCHNAPVHCILYHEGQVFVALSNGDLVVYTRDINTGQWDFDNYRTKPEKSPRATTKMVVVGTNELWCGCQNLIKIINIKDLTDTDSFAVSTDSKKQIHCMVCKGLGVWIAMDKRPQIKLYHAISHDVLADIDVSNPVSKMLASADAIIRQHKAACLRITALLVCNDLLWLGTSAGVVLTLTLPKITADTTQLAMPVIPQGLPYGHTGHVRFLASAEMTDKDQNSLSRGGSRRQSTKRRQSSSSTLNPPKTVSMIISGGDGYEDFRMNSNSESAGRDDSTNHLLVWRAWERR